MVKNIATALIITFGIILMMLGFAFAIDYFDLLNKECCQGSEVDLNLIHEVEACSLVTELPTATSTAILCEQEVPTETPVVTGTWIVPTVTPTDDPPPPPHRTNTPESTSPPNPTSTPNPTATDDNRCNKGGGNGGEDCDPGNNPCKGNNDEDDDDDCDDDDD